MAYSGKPQAGGPADNSVEKLAAELTRLQMENSKLRRKLRQSTGGASCLLPGEETKPGKLSPEDKNILLAAWHTKFAAKASEKLYRKIKALTAEEDDEEGINKVLASSTIRVHASVDPEDRPRMSKEKKKQARGRTQ
ncbi:ORF52 [Ovine gammaherpesvirus 2]|uniref:ORF52 n=1 Tax=Ovine gammaherpesvirus 2 TaxID=10398 RepID=Q2VSI8_9GAMA|nr:ORF52 [Ovine gammaherpesvirus 2]AAX58088.1 ORF52 [Ovine gammaherpesvirus 2]